MIVAGMLIQGCLANYRFWRDSGYVVGALLAGALADGFGMRAAIGAVRALTPRVRRRGLGWDAGDTPPGIAGHLTSVS